MRSDMPRPIQHTPMFQCKRPISEGGHGLSFTKRCTKCVPANEIPQLYSMGNDLLLEDPTYFIAPKDLAKND